MAWTVNWDSRAVKEMKKIDHSNRKKIVDYLKHKISTDEDPRRFGKALAADKSGLWRYRVGDYRILCKIEDESLVVLVVAAGHRKKVYH